MATTITPQTAPATTTQPAATQPAATQPAAVGPLPEVANAFVADRQAFWSRFTGFVTTATIAIVVLLALMAFFLT